MVSVIPEHWVVRTNFGGADTYMAEGCSGGRFMAWVSSPASAIAGAFPSVCKPSYLSSRIK